MKELFVVQLSTCSGPTQLMMEMDIKGKPMSKKDCVIPFSIITLGVTSLSLE